MHIAHQSCNLAMWWTDSIDAADGNAAAWRGRSRPHDYIDRSHPHWNLGLALKDHFRYGIAHLMIAALQSLESPSYNLVMVETYAMRSMKLLDFVPSPPTVPRTANRSYLHALGGDPHKQTLLGRMLLSG